MLEQSAKQWVLGSALGRMLMSGRDTLELVRTALRSPESVGTLANDQLATLLVTPLTRVLASSRRKVRSSAVGGAGGWGASSSTVAASRTPPPRPRGVPPRGTPA